MRWAKTGLPTDCRGLKIEAHCKFMILFSCLCRFTPILFRVDSDDPIVSPSVVDFCGFGLWTVIDGAGFDEREFRQTFSKSCVIFSAHLHGINVGGRVFRCPNGVHRKRKLVKFWESQSYVASIISLKEDRSRSNAYTHIRAHNLNSQRFSGKIAKRITNMD